MKYEFPPSASIGACGEHLVLAHLLKLNFIVGLAPYNTKDYDLIVSSADGSKQVNIQVKTELYSSEPSDFSKLNWMLKSKNEEVRPNLIFSFVHLNQESNLYKVFNIPSREVSDYIKNAHKIWLKLPGPKESVHKSTPLRIMHVDAYNYITTKWNRDKLEDYLGNDEIKFLKDHSLGWMDKYEDDWNILER